MPSDYLVKTRVVKHLPHGLSIETERGQRGIVRIREISWDADIRNNWRKSFPVGWEGEAIQIEAGTNQFDEYSLRLTEFDPWDEWVDENMVGVVQDGTVTGVVPFGAFIELDAGLTGLLHRSTLPAWAQKEPVDLFWPGDKVCVAVAEIDETRRRIGLSLIPLSEPPVAQTYPVKTKHNGNGHTAPDRFLQLRKKRQSILIVEDDPEQAELVGVWLQRVGQRVDQVASAEAALESLEKSQPDLALVDVNLPGINGIELSGRLLERWPGVHVVCATDWARADEMNDALEALQARGAELLIKPLQPDDLYSLLVKDKREETSEKIDVLKMGTGLLDSAAFQANDSIQAMLQQCRKRLTFEQAVLFKLDPNQRTVEVAGSNLDLNMDKQAVAALIYSPVRDAAEDKEIVRADDVPAEKNRFRYLLDLFPTMKACIGVPVPARLPFDYALFVTDRRVHKITAEQQTYVEACALAFAAQLEQASFREQAKLIQRTALIGQLTRAMVHEINNRLGPLSGRLDNLQTGLEMLKKKKEGAALQTARADLLESELAEIQKGVKKIVDTTRLFARITAKGRNEILKIDEIIAETLTLLRDTSDRQHVQLFFTPPESLVVLRTQAAALEQVLLNVMLNAVQQIYELRGDAGGWVQVHLDADEGRHKSHFYIYIEDNGPGIHASLWETIFEPGYTTRADGSGIGLYVSRNLVEEIGGRLFVQASHILGGTTFVLELPRHIL